MHSNLHLQEKYLVDKTGSPMAVVLGIKEFRHLLSLVNATSAENRLLGKIVPSSDPFTDEEWRKIKQLAAKPPVASFKTSKESIEHLRKLLGLA
ncbi:MAG: hypothetical protein HY747_05740 [Elusimicrobia bacterium]|nr:hypothetical protein [Elusimicrobiota bacterium]